MVHLAPPWPQLGRFWVQLGLQNRPQGGGHEVPFGVCFALGAKMAPRPPQEGLRDRILSPTWPPDPLQESLGTRFSSTLVL